MTSYRENSGTVEGGGWLQLPTTRLRRVILSQNPVRSE